MSCTNASLQTPPATPWPVTIQKRPNPDEIVTRPSKENTLPHFVLKLSGEEVFEKKHGIALRLSFLAETEICFLLFIMTIKSVKTSTRSYNPNGVIYMYGEDVCASKNVSPSKNLSKKKKRVSTFYSYV